MFRISDFIDFDNRNRAHCPACDPEHIKRKSLSLSTKPESEGAYKCHRGCTPQMIREALGTDKKQIPSGLIKAVKTSPTITPQQVKKATDQLIERSPLALSWLEARGISVEMIRRYQLGATRSALDGQMKPAISIPVPANSEGTSFYQKKRVEPWVSPDDQPPNYMPWVQKGIPPKVWFTYLPAEARETWLCEGEWDAMLLGWQVRQSELPIAVASFTCGCSTVPPESELSLLPGQVVVFYDLNDKPLPNGDRPGQKGAEKVVRALGSRGKVGQVPAPDNCEVKGWDVSNALLEGYTITDFLKAAEAAILAESVTEKTINPLRERLQWNDTLLDEAADYTDWLVADLLTTNELFVLAAGPRAGKSLLAMTLARSVATGDPFLGRPVLQGPVIYVRKEDSDTKTKERELAQGWERGLPVAWLKKFKLSETPLLRQLAEEIQPRLIVIDTLSRVKDSCINESSSDMTGLIEPLQELAEDLDVCVLLVHHTGKLSVENAGNIDIFDTIRGSSAIRSTCRGSLLLAAGERNYRLLAENGWGKHDLNVVLDANTLTWRLLGNWQPTVNGTQTDQVINYLKSVQSATIDQMAQDLGAPKKSLYKTLERLQASEIAGEKVVKKGRRRSYTYRLEFSEVTQTLFDTIRQGNTLSNSENADSASDGSLYSTKNHFSFKDEGSIIDQTGTGDALIDDRSDSDALKGNIDAKTGSNPDSAKVSPIRQLVDKGDSDPPNPDSEGVALFDTIRDNVTPLHRNPTPTDQATLLSIGDWVEILTGRFAGMRAQVEAISEGRLSVKAPRWAICQTYDPSDLRKR